MLFSRSSRPVLGRDVPTCRRCYLHGCKPAMDLHVKEKLRWLCTLDWFRERDQRLWLVAGLRYMIYHISIYVYIYIYIHTIILKNIKRQKAVQEAPFSILCAQFGEFSGIILRGSMPSPETWGSMHSALVVCRPLSCPARNRWPSSRQGFECHPAWTELAA